MYIYINSSMIKKTIFYVFPFDVKVIIDITKI